MMVPQETLLKRSFLGTTLRKMHGLQSEVSACSSTCIMHSVVSRLNTYIQLIAPCAFIRTVKCVYSINSPMRVYSNGSNIRCKVNWNECACSIRPECRSRTSHKTHCFYNNTTVLQATNLSWFNRRACSNKRAYARLIRQFKHHFLTWNNKCTARLFKSTVYYF